MAREGAFARFRRHVPSLILCGTGSNAVSFRQLTQPRDIELRSGLMFSNCTIGFRGDFCHIPGRGYCSSSTDPFDGRMNHRLESLKVGRVPASRTPLQFPNDPFQGLVMSRDEENRYECVNASAWLPISSRRQCASALYRRWDQVVYSPNEQLFAGNSR